MGNIMKKLFKRQEYLTEQEEMVLEQKLKTGQIADLEAHLSQDEKAELDMIYKADAEKNGYA